MNKKIELLAPCGNYESLIAAVNFGANAVYLATNRFGARGYANNFGSDEIVEAIKFCHIRGVKVYVTMNTLIYETEMDKAIEQVDFLYNNDVDAIIIQDLGLLEVISKLYPDLELHASTQMHVHNVEGAKFITSKGIKRVVIARETPLEVVNKISDLGIDVELFSYGALCVSYSGQCLMSSVLKNRSGNRGVCAQLCRLPYKIYDVKNKKTIKLKDEYLLSLKDLNTIDQIPQIIEANVASIKIEGRMKRFEYVAYITSIFRLAIDAYYKGEEFKLSNEQLDNLKKLFNRGFTKGYVFHTEDNKMINSFRPNHIGIKVGEIIKVSKNMKTIKLCHDIHQHDGLRILNKNHDIGLVANRLYQNDLLVNSAKANEIIEMEISDYCNIHDEVVLTSDYLQLKEIARDYQKLKRRIKIDGFIKLVKDSKIQLTLTDGINELTSYSENKVQKSIKSPMTKEKIEAAVNAIGYSIYEFNNLKIEMENDIFVSVKELKQLRRDIISNFDELRALYYPNRVGKQKYEFDYFPIQLTEDKIFEIDNLDQYHKKGLNFSNNKKIIDDNIGYKTCMEDPYDVQNKGNFISQIGDINSSNDFICNTSFNVVNSYALKFLFDNKAKTVILSNELSSIQIKNMLEAFKQRYETSANVAIMNYGRRVLMTLKYSELLKYSYPNYKLVLENNYLNIVSDSLHHMIILEEKPYIQNHNEPLITNQYYRLLLDDNIE